MVALVTFPSFSSTVHTALIMWISDLDAMLFCKSNIIPPAPHNWEARPREWKNDGRCHRKTNGWATEGALAESLSAGQSHWPKRRSSISKNCQRVTSICFNFFLKEASGMEDTPSGGNQMDQPKNVLVRVWHPHRARGTSSGATHRHSFPSCQPHLNGCLDSGRFPGSQCGSLNA